MDIHEEVEAAISEFPVVLVSSHEVEAHKALAAVSLPADDLVVASLRMLPLPMTDTEPMTPEV